MKNKLLRQVVTVLLTACIILLSVVSLQPEDGWNVKRGHTQYILNGKPVTGWQFIEGSRYYFRDDGALCTGWQTIDGNRYYLNTDGSLAIGWLELAGQHYYLGTDGVCVSGWQEIGGERYCFDTDGALLTGIIL